MISFLQPYAFLLFFLIPLYFLLRKVKILSPVCFDFVFCDWKGKSFEWKNKSWKILFIIEKNLIILIFILLIIAFSDPVKKSKEKIYSSLGNDIFFVLDTSPSMAAKDIDGFTRIECAKKSIEKMILSNKNIRFGIVTFGTESKVLCPPTFSTDFLLLRLQEIQIGQNGNGSALGNGISTAILHLINSSSPKKTIILLTDGENNAGEIHPETSANLAKENNITIYTIGIGTKGNVQIEYIDPVTKKEYFGKLNSDFDSTSLKKISNITKGKYYETFKQNELFELLSSVRKSENIMQDFTYKNEIQLLYKNVLFIVLILTLILLFIRHFILQKYKNIILNKKLIFRSVLFLICGFFIFFAVLGISWGTFLSPTKKSNVNVSFVFDISNSMLANDEDFGDLNNTKISRLKASSIFAQKLLEKMNGVNVSVVLTKGDGELFIPPTDDFSLINSLLNVISPSMMTSPGSNIGKGILKAKQSFPPQFSSLNKIWVFTDCEETEKSIEKALIECSKSGIDVTFIGFGKENPTTIFSGDKKTIVNSSLRLQEIKTTILNVENILPNFSNKSKNQFLLANQKGIGLKLLEQINQKNETQLISYEIKNISRYKFFILISIILFVIAILISELNFNINKKIILFSCLFPLFFGCSLKKQNETLLGSFDWNNSDFQNSVLHFKTSAELSTQENDFQSLAFNIYNLGSSYMMMNEFSSANEKFSLIENLEQNEENQKYLQKLKFASFYNMGIIAFQNQDYQKAQEMFKKALKIDNSDLMCKINFELSSQMNFSKTQQNQSQEILGEQKKDSKNEQNEVFKHIKENDENQWKNSYSNEIQNFSNDY